MFSLGTIAFWLSHFQLPKRKNRREVKRAETRLAAEATATIAVQVPPAGFQGAWEIVAPMRLSVARDK